MFKINNIKPFPVALVLTIFVCSSLIFATFSVFAEQSGSTPDSGTNSRIKTIYDTLVSLGSGSDSAGSWGDWGSFWNRIRSSAEWTPSNATATEGDVLTGKTFYSGSNRTLKTGQLKKYPISLHENCLSQYLYDCNLENNFVLTASGGEVVSVSDNGVTVSINSNQVFKDTITGLYWSDRASVFLDNEFAWSVSDNPVNPAFNSCNMRTTGTANQYCDNQDPMNAYAEDNDVSAMEFCLNLELDADNADGDNNGRTGVETDWYLPTLNQFRQAFLDGGKLSIPSISNYIWTSTLYSDNKSAMAYFINNAVGYDSNYTKNSALAALCVRKD